MLNFRGLRGCAYKELSGYRSVVVSIAMGSNGWIFLGVGGDELQSSEADQAFLRRISNQKILEIPLAWEDEAAYEGVLEFHRRRFTQHDSGVVVEMWTSLDGKRIDDLRPYGGIDIGGGNTYKLLDKITRTGFDRVLIEYLRRGGVLFGGSAGAIVLGETIETVPEENLIGQSARTSGLRLVPGYAVICHYTLALDQRCREFAAKHHLNLMAVPEDGAVEISRGQAVLHGAAGAEISIFSPGGHIARFRKGEGFQVK